MRSPHFLTGLGVPGARGPGETRGDRAPACGGIAPGRGPKFLPSHCLRPDRACVLVSQRPGGDGHVGGWPGRPGSEEPFVMGRSMHTHSRRIFLGALGAAFFTTRGLFAEQLLRTPALDRRAVLPRQAPARYRQRPDHHQRQDHPGRRRDHAPHRPRPRPDGHTRSATRPSRSGSATPTRCTSTAATAARRASKQDKNFQGFGRFTTGSTR